MDLSDIFALIKMYQKNQVSLTSLLSLSVVETGFVPYLILNNG